jgi:MoaA/NifB/PqqE/SkfB family radical SAM enzyme
MYKFSDYLHRGVRMVNNSVRPSHKTLSTIMLYATDRCNSKCKHCYIWKKTPKAHLPFEKIKEIIQSPVVKSDTVIGLEGGEFIMHPEAEMILDYLMTNHPKYDLLSNAVLDDKLIEYTRKYKPMRLFLSLDGTRETYHNLRGVDAYGKVIKVIETLKDELPISVMFTLTPYNNFEDLKHVADVCKKHEIDMRIGIYNTMDYFDTQDDTQDASSLLYSIQDIPDFVHDFKENFDFMALYTHYREGNLTLPCNSIRDSIVIYPNGDIPICQNKQIILGNLFQESLSEIINKKSTIQLHREHQHGCNACWINFHRKYDIVLYRNMEKILPKSWIEMFVGHYNWSSEKREKYKDAIKPRQ